MFRTPGSTSSSLSRRRGAQSKHKQWVLSRRALTILVALSLSIFTMGLLLGTRLVLFSSPSTKDEKTVEVPNPKLRGNVEKVEKISIPQPIPQKMEDFKSAELLQEELLQQQKFDDPVDDTEESKMDEPKSPGGPLDDDVEIALQAEERGEREQEALVMEEEHFGDLKDKEKTDEEKVDNTELLKRLEEAEMKLSLLEHKENLKQQLPAQLEIEEETPPKKETPAKKETPTKKEPPSKQISSEEEEMMARLSKHNQQLLKNPDLTDTHELENIRPEADENAEPKEKAEDFILFDDEEGYDKATLPLPVGNKVDGLALSAWVYLRTISLDAMGSRTILTSDKPCGGSAPSAGWKLYVNSANTADEQLVLEYPSKEILDGVQQCKRLSSLGKQVPLLTWTHVGVTFHPLTGIELYLDGEVVDEDEDVDSIFTPPSSSHLGTSTILGQNTQEGELLRGNIAVLSIATTLSAAGAKIQKQVMRTLYQTGIDEEQLIEKGTVLQNTMQTEILLYPLKQEGTETLGKLQLPESLNQKHGYATRVVPVAPLPLPPLDQNLDYDEMILNYKQPGGHRYEEFKDGSTPYPITQKIKEESDALARTRRVHIRDAMSRAWAAYRKYAWGKDEVLPISKRPRNNWGGTAATLVDSLDTLWIMGMKEEFREGRDYIRDHLNYGNVGGVSVFETTIRSLGGLLAAYDWSGDEVFLKKADDLGGRLLRAFKSPTGLPYGQTLLNQDRSYNAQWLGQNVLLAEVGTLQVEFRYLARATGNMEYADKVNRVFDIIANMTDSSGLYPYQLNNYKNPPQFTNNIITFGAMSDSFYEYLLKVWLQGGKKEKKYREMYDKAMDGVDEKLISKSQPTGLTFLADLVNGAVKPKMDHLACFMAGSLALGAYTHPDGLDSEKAQRDLKTGKALAYTCYQMYARMKTGIAAEAVTFDVDDGDFKPVPVAPYYILRPETVESLFILNQLTGDPVYREWGWEIFLSIEKNCRTDEAYASIKNVNVDVDDVQHEDKMESFFLAETLKYLYLLQDPDTEVDILNTHVFNTEAHPLRIFDKMDTAKIS